jgi:hypothetical protein
MRNLVLLLVVALLAVPAMAGDPVVKLVAGSSAELVDVVYDANGGSLPSGIGINISVDAGSIVEVTGYGTDYDIYPGQILIVDGNVIEPNSPVAGGVDAAGTTTVGASSVILEFGALYDRADSNLAPPSTGTLCTIEVDATCQVALTGDDDRCGTGNGLVAENLVAYAVDSFFDVTIGTVCLGDSTGDGAINGADVGGLIASFNKVEGQAGYNAVYDFTGDSAVNGADIGPFIAVFNTLCP